MKDINVFNIGEKRLIFFATKQALIDQYLENENDASAKTDKKSDQKKIIEKSNTAIFIKEEKQLQKDIENLAETKTEQKKKRLKISIAHVMQRLKKKDVLEQVVENILKNISEEAKPKAEEILYKTENEKQKENDKKFSFISQNINSGKSYMKDEIDTIAEIGILNVVNYLTESVDSDNFFKLFSRINSKFDTKFEGGSENLYASLDLDLTNILASDDISRAHKSIIFDVYARLYIIDEMITVSKDEKSKKKLLENVKSGIIKDKALEEFDYIKGLEKERKKVKNNLEELQFAPESAENLLDETNNLNVNIDLQKKEKAMLDNVRKLLGDKIAKSAEKAMNIHDKKEFEKRQIAYFDYINTKIKPSLDSLEKKGIELTKEYVEKQEKVLHFAINQMVAFSKEEKEKKHDNLSESFDLFYQYLIAVQKSENLNSYIPILEFFTDSAKTSTQNDAMKALNIFTDEDIAIIEGVDSDTRYLQDIIKNKRLKYSEDTQKINILLESDEYLRLKEKDPECEQRGDGSLFEFVKKENILTDEGIVAICGAADEIYKPYYFLNTSDLIKSYGFSKNDVKKAMKNSGTFIFPKYVIQKFARKYAKNPEISNNVISFFTKDRKQNAIENIVNTASKTAIGVVDYAEENGSFSEGGVSEKLADNYNEIFSYNEALKLVKRKRNAIQKVGKILHSFQEKTPNSEYKIELKKTLEQLEKSYQDLSENLQNGRLDEKKYAKDKTEIGKILADFITVESPEEKKKLLYDANFAIMQFKNQFSDDSLSTLLNDAQYAYNKDIKENTGGKNLYILLTGLNPDNFVIEEVSLHEQMLFDLLYKKKGLTKESIFLIQELMSSKNNKGLHYIVSGAKTRYLPDVNQIELEESIFNELENFDIKDSEDLKKLEDFDENLSFQKNLSFLFHELGHSMVEKNDTMVYRFEKLLKKHFKDEYSDVLFSIKQSYNGETEESAFEELLVEIGALLQFSDSVQKKLYDEGTLLDKIFTKISKKELQNLFNVDSYQSGENGLREKNLHTDGRERTVSEEEEYIESGNDKLKKTEKEEALKKENPEFFTKEKRREKRNELMGDKEKDNDVTENGVLVKADEYIHQLKDALSGLPAPVRKNLSQSIKELEEYSDKLKNIFNNSDLIDTEAKADSLIKYAGQILSQAETFANHLSRFHVPPGNLLTRAWKNTRFLSGDNVVDIAKQWWNYFLRRHARKNKARVGAVGAQMASGIAPGLAVEFAKQENAAEMDDVEEYKGAYETMDDGSLYDAISDVGPQDAFRAYMTEMASRGLIDWRRTDDDGKRVYVEQLKRYGTSIRFYESDFEYSGGEESFFNNKLHKAFLDVYGDDNLFWDLYGDNKNNIGSKTDDAVSVAAVRGGAPTQMMEWLYMHEHGEYVNPNVYEGYIKLMVGDGTTDPEYYIYYLYAGVYSGILDDSVFARFYGYNGNDFPPFNGISGVSKAEASKAMKEVLLKKGAKKGSKNPDDYHSVWGDIPDIWIPWVHANVLTIPATIARTIINLGQRGAGKFDHDNAALLAAIGDADTAGKMLAQASTGGLETKNTVYSQSIFGQVQNVLNMGNQDIKFETLQETIIRQAGFFSATDALINTRIESSKSKFRANKDYLKRQPRSGSTYNKNLDTEAYLEMGRAIYSNVHTSKFKELADGFLFAGNFDNNPEGFVEKWKTLREDDYIKNIIFKGEAVPILKNSGNVDQQYAIIVSKIFHFFFETHPDAHKNVESVAKAAQDVYFGKGVAGKEGSKNWSKNPKDGIPYQFVEHYKKVRNQDPLE